MNRKRLGFAGFTARALMLVAAGLLVLSYVSVLFNPAKVWFMAFFGLLFVPLAFLNIFLLLWALARRSGAVLIPLVGLLPSLLFIGSYFQWPSSSSTDTGEESIKLVSYNVGRFCSSRQGQKNGLECRDSIFSALAEEDADIICMQEFYTADIQECKRAIAKAFRGYNMEYYLFRSARGWFGNVTLSRFPIRGRDEIRFEKSANLALWTDCMIGNRSYRVYNCHLESYNISLPGIMNAVATDDREMLKEAGLKMRGSIVRRPQQIGKILQSIEDGPKDAFVCGDFNDNPVSYTYFRLSSGRHDSFRQSGSGFGASYSALWPLLRIDYVLCPSDVWAIGHRTPKLRYSDHYPVVAQFKL
ncbi:MAG: endonuclease/exonuclease/phosphatase family protein [Bacteroidales bacterium]|nr:endonuclease/exonuclease/phosphatase family protein [Bacteroidales bacterium]